MILTGRGITVFAQNEVRFSELTAAHGTVSWPIVETGATFEHTVHVSPRKKMIETDSSLETRNP